MMGEEAKERAIKEAQEVFNIEIQALEKTRNSLNDSYFQILKAIINCTGKVIISAIGKPGHIGNKIAASFSSLGVPSFFMHPAEARHGDLGMVTDKDIIILISYSGESEEVTSLLPVLRQIGCKIIAITGREKSSLAIGADLVFIFPHFKEACYMHLAPTSSTTALLALGDSFAVVASKIRNYSKDDFALHHPAGALGKKLLVKVKNIMHSGEENPLTIEGTTLKEAIMEMTQKGWGILSIVDKEQKLKGIITDGDLRRMLSKNIDIYNEIVDDVMTKMPKVIQQEAKAVDALQIMNDKKIISMPVVDSENKAIGIILLADISRAGIIR